MFFFQVLMALFAFFMIYILRMHYRRHHLSAGEFGGWVVVWFGFVLLSLSPELLRGVADTLHIGRIFDLLIIIAFVILSSAIFHTRLTALELRSKLEDLAGKRLQGKAKKAP